MAPLPPLALRPATAADERDLMRWRNDPATVAASLTSEPVAASEHREWLARKLADERCALLIVEVDGEAAGQVRLDLLGAGEAEVSIGLAPEARGRGLAARALAEVLKQAPALVGAATLVANVRESNEPSLRAFLRAGFHRREPPPGGRGEDEPPAGVVSLEARCAAPPPPSA